MATSSIANLFSFFTPSKPPLPPPKTVHLSVSNSDSPALRSTSTNSNNGLATPLVVSTSNFVNNTEYPLSSSNSNDVMSVVCPSLAYANTLFFRSAYNVQVLVDDNEPEEKLLNRFRREVMRAGVIQECKRRRFFENSQDKEKRKSREAAKRNRRRRPQSRNFTQDRQDTAKTKKDDDDQDNWDLPEGDLPY